VRTCCPACGQAQSVNVDGRVHVTHSSVLTFVCWRRGSLMIHIVNGHLAEEQARRPTQTYELVNRIVNLNLNYFQTCSST
jgi:hypothetical protein